MCGRFSLGLPYDQIQALDGYDVHIGEWINQDQFQPRHNIAPRSQAPVVRRRQAGPASADGDAGELIMHTMKWGVVPHWSKHEDQSLNTINARCENIVEGGGMWNSIKGRKRCAIPCEGYYEWLKKGKERLPHFTKREDGKLLLLAGLYDVVTLEGQTTPLWTFTVVTTDANKEFSWLHDRQPVILPTTEALQTWLDTSSQQWRPELTKLVQPYSDVNSKLICYAVPKEVGKVGAESATFIQPIAQRQDGIQALFAKQKKTQSVQAESKLSPASPEYIENSQSSSVKGKKRSATRDSEPIASSHTTPSKRRKLHESSPAKLPKPEIIDLCDADADEDEDKATNKAPTEKSNTWEDDKNIEHSAHDNQHNAKQQRTPAKKVRSAKSPQKVEDAPSKKITSFFKQA